jgi:hypothetical protein
MKYLKYADWIAADKVLPDDTAVLLSSDEYSSHKDELHGIPICVSPTGEAPTEDEEV